MRQATIGFVVAPTLPALKLSHPSRRLIEFESISTSQNDSNKNHSMATGIFNYE